MKKKYLELNENERRMTAVTFEVFFRPRKFPYGLVERTFEKYNPVVATKTMTIEGKMSNMLALVERTQKYYDEIRRKALRPYLK